MTGVINSIGKLRDIKARPVLARMIYRSSGEVACAAAAALGSIGGAVSARELRAALVRTRGATKAAVADAALVCAERLLEEGKRDEALALYAVLSVPGVPKPARLAAMHGTIREETSLCRPR